MYMICSCVDVCSRRYLFENDKNRDLLINNYYSMYPESTAEASYLLLENIIVAALE